MTLEDIKAQQSAVVIKIKGQGALRRRLLEMGLTPGTNVYVHKTAPSGDPLEIILRGYHLTLRKQEANSIEVTEVVT